MSYKDDCSKDPKFWKQTWENCMKTIPDNPQWEGKSKADIENLHKSECCEEMCSKTQDLPFTTGCPPGTLKPIDHPFPHFGMEKPTLKKGFKFSKIGIC